MEKEFLVFVVVFLAFCSLSEGSRVKFQPTEANAVIGVKETIGQSCLNEIVVVGVPIVLKEIKTLTIPDVSGKASTPVGKIDYTLSKITMDKITLKNVNLTTVGNGLSVTCADLGVHIHLHWKYRECAWPHISDDGSADVSTNDSLINIDLGMKAVKGELSLSVLSSKVDLKHFDIDIHGTFSFLYNLFDSELKSAVRDALQSEFKDVIQTQVNKLLATLPVIEKIDDFVEIDYALTADPVIDSQNGRITTEHLGEFYPINKHIETPGSPIELPNYAVDRYIQAFISEWSFNSLGYSHFAAGAISFIFTASQLPESQRHFLNTTDYKILIPELYQKYPDMLMELHTDAAAAPYCTISPDGMCANALLNVAVMVIKPDGSKAEAFVLQANAGADAVVSVDGILITGKIDSANVTLAVNRTDVGPIDISKLQAIVTFLVQSVLVPFVNSIGAKGFKIPTVEGLTFTNSVLAYGEQYISLGVDWSYSG